MASRNNPDAPTEWETPSDLFHLLHRYAGGFAVDAAANADNHLLPAWYGPGSPMGEEDALEVAQWLSPAWCNPPYLRGGDREAWLEKFHEQAELGVTTVALLPAATGTKWFAELVVPFADLIFLKGRVPFQLPGRDKPSTPNHDSVVAVYGPEHLRVRGRKWLDWRKAVAA